MSVIADVAEGWALPDFLRPRGRSQSAGMATTSVADPYVGPDRRGGVAVSSRTPRILVVAGLFAGIALIGIEQLVGDRILPAEWASSLGATIDSMAISVGLLALVGLGARHRASPDRLTVRSATLVGVMALSVLPLDVANDADISMRIAGFVLVSRAALLLLGTMVLLGPDIRAGLRVPHHVAAVVASVWLAGSLTSGVLALAPITTAQIVELTLLTSAIASAVVCLVLGATGLRRRNSRLVIVGVVLIAFAIADITATFSADFTLGLVTGKVMRLYVLAALLLLTVLELRDLALRERDTAMQAQGESARAADRLVMQLGQQERFVHDARNALLAIEGGLHAIRGGESDEPMIDAVKLELDRLRRTIESDDDDPLPQTFDMAQALAPMVDCYRAAGTPVTLTAQGPLWARGRPSVAAEITQNLIDNAVRHAGGSDIAIWVFERDGEVHVRVGDRGNGISVEDRDAIFEHGHSGGQSSGLGLHIARKLVESQRGELRVSNRHGGGAIFSFTVPSGRPVEAA